MNPEKMAPTLYPPLPSLPATTSLGGRRILGDITVKALHAVLWPEGREALGPPSLLSAGPQETCCFHPGSLTQGAREKWGARGAQEPLPMGITEYFLSPTQSLGGRDARIQDTREALPDTTTLSWKEDNRRAGNGLSPLFSQSHLSLVHPDGRRQKPSVLTGSSQAQGLA